MTIFSPDRRCSGVFSHFFTSSFSRIQTHAKFYSSLFHFRTLCILITDARILFQVNISKRKLQNSIKIIFVSSLFALVFICTWFIISVHFRYLAGFADVVSSQEHLLVRAAAPNFPQATLPLAVFLNRTKNCCFFMPSSPSRSACVY